MTFEEATKRELASTFDDVLRILEPDTYTREGLADTPDRMARFYLEQLAGYRQSPTDILKTTFCEDGCETYGGLLIVRDIPFYSLCEHHMVPFFGKAHVGYVPNEKVVGLSKLARLVDCFAKRLQVQERMTDQIAEAVWSHLTPKGVMVVIEAEHLCMAMRGIKKPGAQTITSSIRGVFIDSDAARNEFLQLIRR